MKLLLLRLVIAVAAVVIAVVVDELIGVLSVVVIVHTPLISRDVMMFSRMEGRGVDAKSSRRNTSSMHQTMMFPATGSARGNVLTLWF